MPLSETHAKYHSLGPKDVGFKTDEKPVMEIGVIRTTSQTGEQHHINVPVYSDDSRESLMTRLNFAYSIVQERMEEENKAVLWRNERQQEIGFSSELMKKEKKALDETVKKLQKLSRAGKITEEEAKERIAEEYSAHGEKFRLLNLRIRHCQEELDKGVSIPRPAEIEKSILDIIKGSSDAESDQSADHQSGASDCGEAGLNQ